MATGSATSPRRDDREGAPATGGAVVAVCALASGLGYRLLDAAYGLGALLRAFA